MRVSNLRLVEELKAGDRRGCTHLLDAYQDRLGYEAEQVFEILHEDAEEIVNDTLLTIVRKIQRFDFRRGESDFHYWVMAIFRNRVRDFIRRQACTKGVLEYFDGRRLEEAKGASPVEREVLAAVVRKYVEGLHAGEPHRPGMIHRALQGIDATLERLEPWERVLLRCRALRVPYEEIAGYTGKSVKQLKVYHERVKRKFVTMYQNNLIEARTDGA